MKFYELSPAKRRAWLKEQGIVFDDNLEPATLACLNNLSENVISRLELPVGLIKGLIVNGHSYLVPLATEEPSVVAAANHGASLFAKAGGVQANSRRDGIYGQIVLESGPDLVLSQLEAAFPTLIAETNTHFASLVNHGGGVREVIARLHEDLVYLRVLIDPAQAMGANRANAILEFMAANLAAFPGITAKLFAILSNYPSQMTTAKVSLPVALVGGADIASRIALLSQIGLHDPFRAVTNNKGIMNGVDGVLLASGNDTRAVEAACGVWASRSGSYTSLSNWQLQENQLVGELTLPLALGTVGGSITARKDVQQNFRILGTEVSAAELANVIAATGLANNLAALLAIATTGIQAGHMKLQVRNLVADLDASPAEKKQIMQMMIAQKTYSHSAAQSFLKQIKEEQ